MRTNTHGIASQRGTADKRQWKRYLRDVKLYLETEKLDVDFSHGARLLSRLTGSARKYAETIELDQIRRSTGADKDTREGMIAGVKHRQKSLERAMGLEDATKKEQVQQFFYKKLQRRRGQPMAEWVNVFEKAVLDMEAEGLNVKLKNLDWHLFENSSLTLERQERVLGAAEGEYDFAAIRVALIKLFPDTIIRQEKRSTPNRKPMERRQNDRFKNRFCKPRDGKTGRDTAHETDAQDAEENPNCEEEESCEEESDLTAAFEREMDELASVVEELADTLDVQDVEDLRELSDSMYEGLATIKKTHAKLREKTRNRGYLFSRSFRFTTCILERYLPWKGQDET